MDRRHFLRGLIAAPAVVAAANIMPVRLPLILRPTLLTPAMITRESIWKFMETNVFLMNIEQQILWTARQGRL